MLVAIRREDIPPQTGGRPRSPQREVAELAVDEWMALGCEASEVEGISEGMGAERVAQALRDELFRRGIRMSTRVIRRGERVFLETREVSR